MAFPNNTVSIDAQDFNQNWTPVRPNTQSMNFYDAAIEFGKGTTNIEMCSFYSNGCPLGPDEVQTYQYYLESTGQSTPCETPNTEVYYYSDRNGTPQVGDTWYTSNPGVIGSTELNGGGHWWYWNLGTTSLRISTGGVILNVTTCP